VLGWAGSWSLPISLWVRVAVDWVGQIGPPFSASVHMIFCPAVVILLLSPKTVFFLFSTRLGGEFELGEFGTPSFEVSNRTSSWKWLCGELCVFLAVHSNCLLLGDRIKNGGVRRGILSSWSVLCAYRHPVFHRCWPGRRWNEIAVPVLFL
jgi:hypothetical protein